MADFKYTVKFGGDFTQLSNQAQTALKNIQSSFKGNTTQEVTQMLDQVKQIQSKLPDLVKKANEPFTSNKSYEKFVSESREVLKTVESLQKAFNTINQHSQDWKMEKLLSPADLQNFNTLSSILKEIKNFKMPDLSMKKTLEDNVTRAKKAQDDLKTSAKTQELTAARKTFADRKTDAGDLYKSSYDNLGAEKYVAALEKERDKLRETKEKQAALKQQIEEATKQQKDIDAAQKRLDEAISKQKEVSENPNSTKKQRKSADYWVKTREQELNTAKDNNTTQMPAENITLLTDDQLTDLENKVTKLEQLIQRQKTAIADAQKYGVKPNARAIDSALAGDKAAADQDYTKAETELKQYLDVVKQAQDALDNLRKQVADLYQAMGLQPPIDFKAASAQDLSNTLTNLSNTIKSDVNNSFNTMNNEVNTLGRSMGDLSKKVEENTDAEKNYQDTLKNVSAIENRIKYFFSWYNAINLVRRGISSAVSSIKELDAAMTETAIVTNFSVSDMWERLPEYTQHANELGVSVKGMYDAATLYYQQGLATNQAMELSVETMKMARIAGLEASEATDRMTNALRAFNMELNDTSAQRVNDVYSKIAAISASNVDELSTAMTKVASLAANVGMTFEQTTAYLATGIETTRESADSIGTA